jgi:hypothetical protein
LQARERQLRRKKRKKNGDEMRERKGGEKEGEGG